MIGCVVWFTGLPSSGKTTLAEAVRQRIGRGSCVLDSDRVRAALIPEPGYDEVSRADFYTSLANLAAMLARQDLIALVPATANRRQFRDYAREVAPAFIEVYVATPAGVCATRDDKGLWASSDARVELPGAGVDYEVPTSPDVIASGGHDSAAIDKIFELLWAERQAGLSLAE